MTLTPYQRAAAFEAAFADFAKAGASFIRGRDQKTGKERIHATWVGGQNYKNKSKLYGAYPAGYLERMFSVFPDARRVLHLFSGSLTAEQVEAAWEAVVRHAPMCGIKKRGRCDCAAAPLNLRPTQIRFDNALHPIARAAKPDVIGDATELRDHLWRVGHPAAFDNPFDLILADPPYRLADQRRYWREAMYALPGDCGRCGLPVENGVGRSAAHAPVYLATTHEGAIICVDRFKGKLQRDGELQLPGYVRFKPLNKQLVVEQCAKVLAPGGTLVWLDESWPQFRSDTFYWMGSTHWIRSTMHRYRTAMFFERLP